MTTASVEQNMEPLKTPEDYLREQEPVMLEDSSNIYCRGTCYRTKADFKGSFKRRVQLVETHDGANAEDESSENAPSA